MNKHYIYYIYHFSKKKYYVGETSDYIERFKQHMKNGARGYSNKDSLYSKRGLYLAMNKYGITDFGFKVIEECDYKDRYKREAYWICKLNSHKDNGYNSIAGFNGTILKAMCENPKVKLSTKECEKILAGKNKIEYIECSKWIDTELIKHAQIIKTEINKTQMNKTQMNKTQMNKEKKENIKKVNQLSTSSKCKKGYSNLYILKDIFNNKVYIGTSQLYSPNEILKKHIYNAKEYKISRNNGNIINGLYEYMDKNKKNSSFEIIILHKDIEYKSLTDRYKYQELINQGYSIEDLLSSNQKMMFKEIEVASR